MYANRHSISRLSSAAMALLPTLFITACATTGTSGGRPSATPVATVADLLAADRAYAAAAANTDLVTALSNMFAADVVMPAPGERLASGLGEAVEVLRSNPLNERSRMNWTPIRGGISADAQHGFTYGYLTTTRPDGSRVPGKYLAYWVRSGNGWQVSAYKRAQRAEGEVSVAERAPAVPARLVPPATDAERTRFAEELAETERSFSRDAQAIGLGQAFVRYAAPDAMNMGGPTNAGFLFGPDEIGTGIGSNGAPGTTVVWAPSDVRVATSGDLGVTMGFITVTQAAVGGTPTMQRVPFFTVWRREDPTKPWKFVAE
jgi:hypothetical protein